MKLHTLKPMLYTFVFAVLRNRYNSFYVLPYGVGNMPKNVPTTIDSASIPIITPPTLALLATTAPVVNTAATEATTIIIKIFILTAYSCNPLNPPACLGGFL